MAKELPLEGQGGSGGCRALKRTEGTWGWGKPTTHLALLPPASLPRGTLTSSRRSAPHHDASAPPQRVVWPDLCGYRGTK